MKCYKKDYPRPQFVRDNWENLNGIWDFEFDDDECGEVRGWYRNFPGTRKIQVPFTFETSVSGIGDEKRHHSIWYRRMAVADKERLKKERYLLHFEGSDYRTKLWVNGQYAGSNQGAYTRFSFDITELMQDGENQLVVKVEDSFDMQQPRGKQRWLDQNFGCWYVQTTGIWKTVWSEYVSAVRIQSIKMTPELEDFSLKIVSEIETPESYLGENLMISASISYKGTFINKVSTAVTSAQMEISADVRMNPEQMEEWMVRLWSPETPDLYDIEFTLIKNDEVVDRAGSYFAMREIRIDGSNVVLNHQALYQRLILDQGYWEESHLTPPDEEALKEDIDKIKAVGYNGLRMHQKTEDERFLYWCDVKGMLVWCEMPSSYRFTDYAAETFTREWMQIVRQNYNHPCIITWTPFNESWGIPYVATNRNQQHFTEAIYHLTKSFDNHRPVIVNDGWEHTVSDIITLHDYEEAADIFLERYEKNKDEIMDREIYYNKYRPAMAKGYTYRGQPVMISEYGGIAFHGNDDGWGYGNKVKTEDEFLRRYGEITDAIKKIPYICGYCYTQVTDVQQEVNGLMYIDRTYKVDPEIIREINQRNISALRVME